MDSQSSLSVLEGRSEQARDAIMYQVFTQNGGNPREFSPFAERGIRMKDWLYVRHKNRRLMPHDLKADWLEQLNLVDDPEHKQLMDDFDTQITTHVAPTGDDWDMAADLPPPNFFNPRRGKDIPRRSAFTKRGSRGLNWQRQLSEFFEKRIRAT